MYVHVPSAWIGLASFSLISLFSILNFVFKTKNLYLINKSIAPGETTYGLVGLNYSSLGTIELEILD